MQFLHIKERTKLTDIANRVGDRNVEYVLSVNDLHRTPYIGKEYTQKINAIYTDDTIPAVDWQRKSTILNKFVDNADTFEAAALLNEPDWKVLSSYGTFPGMIKLPETVILPDSSDVLGIGKGVSKTVYDQAMIALATPPHEIDSAIFNEYSNIQPTQIIDYQNTGKEAMQYFNIPWGEITLHSEISNKSIDLPVYPEDYDDSAHANFTQMPDLLYNYEPWLLYTTSGPRTNTFKFDIHRDMWSGDHRDGRANELIRFCEASCYPDYKGSAVVTDRVTLYIAGKPLISGVMTDCAITWDGPIGLDGWYLHFTLSITITEVSKQALNYGSVSSKSLIM